MLYEISPGLKGTPAKQTLLTVTFARNYSLIILLLLTFSNIRQVLLVDIKTYTKHMSLHLPYCNIFKNKFSIIFFLLLHL